ncbi:multicopper oxidase family protein [Cellulomonas sp. ICMP 17802]|uniref:multicopper oxidase family protein n=1 Tax=Cellulomonas sp. ICMP 17802 TaxID=3239199 RepID=UPI00351BD4E6
MTEREALGRRRRVVAGVVASLLVLGPLAWFWWTSLVPANASVMDMGYPDTGGGPTATTGPHGHGTTDGPTVSVAELTGPSAGVPDVDVTLTAESGPVTVGGRTMPGFTLNGSSPGPTIDAQVGDLVQVTLVNRSVADGTTLHWHGVDVPNAEDGVAGVTQDAVPVGGSHVYRFVVDHPGTYWYHSHQVSHAQVRGGLFGVLVVHPVADDHAAEVVAAVHRYGSTPTVDGSTDDLRTDAAPGDRVRVRVVNTGSGVLRAWVPGAPFRLLAVDGRDLHEPGPVDAQAVVLAGGGRADLEVTVPDDGTSVRVRLGSLSVVVGPSGDAPDGDDPRTYLDLLSYGTPTDVGFDPRAVDRRFTYAIGRRPGFVDGRPGLQWTINGHTYPDVPMFVVSEGDVVRMTLRNTSGQAHPMHLHGHHLLVLSRDGTPSTGSPWWADSLELAAGQTYEVAFVADNPGVWMDHCHNLPHAQQGLVAHLAYTGVTDPYVLGGESDNAPE